MRHFVRQSTIMWRLRLHLVRQHQLVQRCAGSKHIIFFCRLKNDTTHISLSLSLYILSNGEHFHNSLHKFIILDATLVFAVHGSARHHIDKYVFFIDFIRRTPHYSWSRLDSLECKEESSIIQANKSNWTHFSFYSSFRSELDFFTAS